MADDYRQRLQWSYGNYRESNTTMETTRAIEARATIILHNTISCKLTKAHYEKYEKSEMIVTIKCET